MELLRPWLAIVSSRYVFLGGADCRGVSEPGGPIDDGRVKGQAIVDAEDSIEPGAGTSMAYAVSSRSTSRQSGPVNTWGRSGCRHTCRPRARCVAWLHFHVVRRAGRVNRYPDPPGLAFSRPGGGG